MSSTVAPVTPPDTHADRGDRWRYAVAMVLFGSGLLHLAVQAVLGGPWSGAVSWRKPTTFGLSFGLTLATLNWVTTYLPVRARVRERLLTVFAGACVAEMAVITVQPWRRVPSHFNVSTPLNAAFAYTAAAGGAVLIATTLAFAATAGRPNPVVPASMRLAVRMGLGSFVAALAIGAAMIGRGVYATRNVSQQAAYTAASGLKSGHGVTMHGILILPVLAWLASHTAWTEVRRFRVVAFGCGGYLLAASVVVVSTAAGVDPLDPSVPIVIWVPIGAGLVTLVAAGTLTLAGVAAARAARAKRPATVSPGV